MNQEQIDLIHNGFHKAISQRDLFATDFYRELFRLAPELRQQFPENLSKQKLKLMESLIVIIQGLEDEPTLRDYLNSLGNRHSREFGTKPEHYAVLSAALMTTLSTYLGEMWTPEMKTLWSKALDRISTYMLQPTR